MKKTAVIGAGAMGILFGGKLAETGNDITMIDVVPAVIDSINQNGIIIAENGEEKRNNRMDRGRCGGGKGYNKGCGRNKRG